MAYPKKVLFLDIDAVILHLSNIQKHKALWT